MSSDRVFRLPFRHLPGGPSEESYVQMTVLVENPMTGQHFYAKSIIDSGAALSVFDASVADRIGIRLEDGEMQHVRGVGGTVVAWRHEVRLHLPGGVVVAKVVFQRNLLTAGLLGMSGFFEHFRVTVDGQTRVCELERISPKQP